MIQFVLAIFVYFVVMNQYFDKSVRPIGRKLQKDLIPLPRNVVSMWILVAGCLFPMSSFIKARESDWETKESLAAMSVILGVVLGLLVDIR